MFSSQPKYKTGEQVYFGGEISTILGVTEDDHRIMYKVMWKSPWSDCQTSAWYPEHSFDPIYKQNVI